MSTVTRHCLLGLQYLHSKEVVHRDIKPMNILLSKQRNVTTLTDFGMSRKKVLSKEGPDLDGTIEYMAPERLMDENYSYPSDIWSMGVVVAEASLGRYVRREVETSISRPFLLRAFWSPGLTDRVCLVICWVLVVGWLCLGILHRTDQSTGTWWRRKRYESTATTCLSRAMYRKSCLILWIPVSSTKSTRDRRRLNCWNIGL